MRTQLLVFALFHTVIKLQAGNILSKRQANQDDWVWMTPRDGHDIPWTGEMCLIPPCIPVYGSHQELHPHLISPRHSTPPLNENNLVTLLTLWQLMDKNKHQSESDQLKFFSNKNTNYHTTLHDYYDNDGNLNTDPEASDELIHFPKMRHANFISTEDSKNPPKTGDKLNAVDQKDLIRNIQSILALLEKDPSIQNLISHSNEHKLNQKNDLASRTMHESDRNRIHKQGNDRYSINREPIRRPVRSKNAINRQKTKVPSKTTSANNDTAPETQVSKSEEVPTTEHYHTKSSKDEAWSSSETTLNDKRSELDQAPGLDFVSSVTESLNPDKQNSIETAMRGSDIDIGNKGNILGENYEMISIPLEYIAAGDIAKPSSHRMGRSSEEDLSIEHGIMENNEEHRNAARSVEYTRDDNLEQHLPETDLDVSENKQNDKRETDVLPLSSEEHNCLHKSKVSRTNTLKQPKSNDDSNSGENKSQDDLYFPENNSGNDTLAGRNNEEMVGKEILQNKEGGPEDVDYPLEALRYSGEGGEENPSSLEKHARHIPEKSNVLKNTQEKFEEVTDSLPVETHTDDSSLQDISARLPRNSDEIGGGYSDLSTEISFIAPTHAPLASTDEDNENNKLEQFKNEEENINENNSSENLEQGNEKLSNELFDTESQNSQDNIEKVVNPRNIRPGLENTLGMFDQNRGGSDDMFRILLDSKVPFNCLYLTLGSKNSENGEYIVSRGNNMGELVMSSPDKNAVRVNCFVPYSVFKMMESEK